MSQFDEKLNGLARSQKRLVTRPQVLADGMSDNITRRRRDDGRADGIQWGVYLIGGGPADWVTKLHAAVMAAGRGAEVSRRAATRLYGLDGILDELVEINVPYTHGPVPKDTILHRTRRAEPPVIVRGIPTTSVDRTLLELGASVRQSIVDKAVASAIRKRLTTVAKLQAYLDAHGGRGRAGVTALRRALERYSDGSPPPGSDGETAFFVFLDDRGIARPIRQHRVILSSGQPADIDFAWPNRMKALEFDGLATRADPSSHDGELVRQNGIIELGWDLRRFSPRALRDRPRQTYREIARWLAD